MSTFDYKKVQLKTLDYKIGATDTIETNLNAEGADGYKLVSTFVEKEVLYGIMMKETIVE